MRPTRTAKFSPQTALPQLMADYQPTSRRPIADMFRATAALPVKACVRLGIHADLVSYGSLVAAAGAGICFWQAEGHLWLLLVGSFLCGVRLWLNMLDGMVALASGKASLRGEIINELPDRFSDVMIFVGVAHSGLCHWQSGYWAAIFALITAYVGTLAQAVGARRQFGGLMSKPWRMTVVVVGACTTLALLWWGDGKIEFARLRVFDWTCLIVVVGCLQTMPRPCIGRIG